MGLVFQIGWLLGIAATLAAAAWLAATGLRHGREGAAGARWAVAAGALAAMGAAAQAAAQVPPVAEWYYGLFENGPSSPWAGVTFAGPYALAGWCGAAAAGRAFSKEGRR